VTRWIELDGAVNIRDLGGLPTSSGGSVQPNRLIRADNLQGLSPSDVRSLVDDHDVRAVADLRTGVEVDSEGPGPMTREPLVTVAHLSLFPEAGRNTDAAALDDSDAPIVLPWQERRRSESADRRGAAGVYLGYLEQRPDSAVAALRLIARSPGATIVHCAAGKDRTGVIVALALSEVGVTREAIVADYATSAERIERVLARLAATRTYSGDLDLRDVDRHRPKAATMQRALDSLDDQYGGASAWLRNHGWTDADGSALQTKLLA
jgi:protein tyrosine/serine phosphatase